MAYDVLQHPQKQAFLVAYSMLGIIVDAAKAAGIDRTAHYRWLDDPTYQAAFESAQQTFIESLERSAITRARDGLVKKKFTTKGQPIIDPATGEQYQEREYSDTLTIFLLKAARPEKYRDNAGLADAAQPLPTVIYVKPRDPAAQPAQEPDNGDNSRA